MTSIHADSPYINHISLLIKFNTNISDTKEEIEALLREFLHEINLSIVNISTYKFQPIGLTTVAILSQSHCVLHTWPEYNTIHIDVLSCVDIDIPVVENAAKKIFAIYKVKDCKTYSWKNTPTIID